MGSNASKAAQSVKNQAQQKYEEVQGHFIDGKLELLKSWDHLTINQRVDWINVIKICDKEIEYNFHQAANDQHQLPVGMVGLKSDGRFVEESSWFCRCMVRACREFNGKIEIDGSTVCKLQVPYKCHSIIPCCSCPFTEPEVYILDPGGAKMIGMMKQHYYICWCNSYEPCPLIQFAIYEMEHEAQVPKSEPLYWIAGNCCQTGSVCCPFSCMGCPVIEYGILKGKNPDPKEPLGLIKNLCADCPQELFTKADRFGIDFPKNASGHEKLLIIAGALWLNYLQYEFL